MSILGGPLPNNKKKRKTILEKKIEKLKKPGKTYTKAQLLALKRKAQDKSISDVKAENKKKVTDAAAKRHKTFKKTGKSTIEERRAAQKKKMQDAAKKRYEDFKAKRKLKIKSKKEDKTNNKNLSVTQKIEKQKEKNKKIIKKKNFLLNIK